jgi:hypothetical protein
MSSPPEAIPLEAPSAPRLGRRLAAWLSGREILVMSVVLIVVFVALRLPFITADPPGWLPNRARVHELFSDPPAKSYEARNHALFGVWTTSPVDNYQFWRIQAPLWVYPISWFYRLFGVGYAQMRVFSTLCATSGLALFLVLAAKRLRGFPFWLAGAFLTFNYYYICYARSGLLEALLNTYVIFTVLSLHLARRHLAWLLVAEWGLAGSFLTKQTGSYLLPLVVVAGALAWNHHRKRGASRALLVAPFAQGAAIAAGLTWYVLRDAYWRTVTWNYGHMIFNEDATSAVDVSRFPLLAILARLVWPDTWAQGFYALFPVAGGLATLGFFRVVYRAARRRGGDEWDRLIAGWLAASFGVPLLTPLTGVHYRLILFPPVALMGASFLAFALDHPRMRGRPRLGRLISGVLLASEVITHGIWYADWAIHRTYSISAAGDLLRRTVGDEGNVFCGMWSGPMVFDTKNKYYYIKIIFNTDAKGIAQLGLTHILEIDKGDLAAETIAQTHPEMMRSRRSLLTLTLRDRTVQLYAFKQR